MSDGTSAGGPPPGWLYDSNTQQTRWWDGTRWTEHVRPTEPAYQQARVAPAPQQSSNQAQYSQPQTYGSFSYAAAPLTSKNGPAKASLILILLLVLGVGAILCLLTGVNPARDLRNPWPILTQCSGDSGRRVGASRQDCERDSR